MLDTLAVDAFTPLVGDAFALRDETAGPLAFTLIEARPTEHAAPARDARGARTPFALVFRGPAEPLLPQRIRRLEHPGLGVLEIFVVPIGRDDEGVRYEAIFA